MRAWREHLVLRPDAPGSFCARCGRSATALVMLDKTVPLRGHLAAAGAGGLVGPGRVSLRLGPPPLGGPGSGWRRLAGAWIRRSSGPG